MSGGLYFHLILDDAPCRCAFGPIYHYSRYIPLYRQHSFYDTFVMGIIQSASMERTNDPDIMDIVYCLKTCDCIECSPLKFSKTKNE